MRLALTPDTSWKVDFQDLVPIVGEAGFDALGCPVAHATNETRWAFGSAGLRCHELMALVITGNADKTIAYANRIAGAVNSLSIPWVNTVYTAPPTGDVAKTIRRCAAILAEAGSAMAVEFSPAGSVPGITEGLEVVDIAGHGAALLIDTWHFAVGPSTWADLEALPADKIAYLQFCDAAEPISDDIFDETMNRRCLPGDGIAGVERFTETIRASGFDGYISVEVLNSELRSVPVRDAVGAIYESASRYWR
ncbi:hypothetical protein A5685_15770 [Mycobacterium colombiense]|uniref:Xylose isomerase-like TIM barrel domain-containing protein n=1 Tax=Mycobacterium colombiense TaxID=339268 RepID=A0A1A2RIS1_9MYCO|nr:sugar phosphate isomerase/epimerase [Mycobacterium colombiense]OBH51774.1 hypothetical protein A5685_15770 [Mycobacterium colombiense]